MDWILWIIPPFPIKHQKNDDDDAADADDDDDSPEVWSNVRVGGYMFQHAEPHSLQVLQVLQIPQVHRQKTVLI